MKRTQKVLDCLLLGMFFLYPLIFLVAGMKFFNSGRFVWSIILPVFLLWLALNFKRYDARFPVRFLTPFAPIILAAVVLSIYHRKFVDSETISKLIIIGCASGGLATVYVRGLFFKANSAFCFLALVWVSGLCIALGVDTFFDRYAFVINQNEISPMVMLISGIALLASQSTIGKERIFHILAALAGLTAVMLTQSRGGLLLITVLLCFVFVTSKISWKKKFSIFLCLLGIGAAVLFITNGFQGKLERVYTEPLMWLEGKGRSTSIGARLSLWYAGLVDIFPNFPVFGTGIQSGHLREFPQLVSLTKQPGWSIAWWPHFHNDLVQMIVEGGLLYLAAGISSLLLLIKKYRGHVVVLWMVCCAVVSGLTEIFYFQPRDFVFFVLILVLIDVDIFKGSWAGKEKLSCDSLKEKGALDA